MIRWGKNQNMNMNFQEWHAKNLHNDVIDWDVDELDEEPDEPHHGKPDCRGRGNTLKLCGNNHTTFTLAFSLSLSLSKKPLPFMSGLVQRFTSLIESFAKSFRGFTYCCIWSMAAERRTIDSAKQITRFFG